MLIPTLTELKPSSAKNGSKSTIFGFHPKHAFLGRSSELAPEVALGSLVGWPAGRQAGWLAGRSAVSGKELLQQRQAVRIDSYRPLR